jgi:hypothetical protein
VRRVTIFVALALLAGCSQGSERTYTVDEFVAEPELLARTISDCRDNPGQLRDTPNCRNAEAADGRLRLQNMRQALGG